MVFPPTPGDVQEWATRSNELEQVLETGFAPEDAVENTVEQAVVSIVGTMEKPVPLFITGPPVGQGEDYLFAIVSGEPEYKLLFLVSETGSVTASPSTTYDPVLTLVSDVSDASTVFKLSSASGDVLLVAADGAFQISQPGEAIVFNVSNDGSIMLGKQGGLMAFFGGEPQEKPEVPASPAIQDVVDALVALNLISQAE